jgi:hypothetical protein
MAGGTGGAVFGARVLGSTGGATGALEVGAGATVEGETTGPTVGRVPTGAAVIAGVGVVGLSTAGQ